MIEYDNTFEALTINCDECSGDETFEGSWQDCMSDAKKAGWLISKKNGDFVHFCSIECQKK